MTLWKQGGIRCSRFGPPGPNQAATDSEGKRPTQSDRKRPRKTPFSPVFPRKQGDFPRQTGMLLSTNEQSLRGIWDLDDFSKSK